MKQHLITLTILLILLAACGASPVTMINRPVPSTSNSAASNDDAQQILAATVRIILYVPAGNAQYHFARGLGTRVRDGGRSLIVTHDHWGEALLAAEFIHFFDTDNQLLLEISGDLFRNLILYRDSGTMVLTAPNRLPGIAEFGDPAQVTAGQTLTVLHQDAGARPEQAVVSTHGVVVEQVAPFAGQSSYNLRGLNGEKVGHGDSGGGIWHNGLLVGNMWATMTTLNWQVWNWAGLDNMTIETDESFAAVYPLADTESRQELVDRQHLQTILLEIAE